MNPITQTALIDGTVVPNTQVIDKIRSILSGEFVCYGYHKVTMQLKQEDFIINRKKVYRLMDENNLLLGKTIKTTGKQQWLKTQKK